ncbi:hypothetical protein DQ04_02131020 [Trypanosoma grayi]|uniref:hypothetical protein n=1 Tax=Trypanosoma grayi TaxID=71804 RepID=UPI0004F488A7|nr:hypothetical protein DQ04_02131020 [Trypanosoma grayi]KEG11938.1 hypothetical protein DQ04_02131020 [Trypanosoma grayi]
METGLTGRRVLEDELQLLNECLRDALAVHLFVTRSLVECDGGCGTVPTVRTLLLEEEVQLYLRQLLQKYTSSLAMRKKLRSAKSLHYLQCLTDVNTQKEFIHVAAHPSFADSV